jgi:hypothetical protein
MQLSLRSCPLAGSASRVVQGYKKGCRADRQIKRSSATGATLIPSTTTVVVAFDEIVDVYDGSEHRAYMTPCAPLGQPGAGIRELERQHLTMRSPATRRETIK